ncbi:hypothetical protein KQX54_020754 [Cotesia glomerata]|uniref:Uncharacterized protein n=1 Tax=Cotesia glomerata TaxID=32391 RepID=A0AAV7IG68_COTGL|nr:hypothetical protein KQX54_020754 [Cotesia glomerata]
MGSWVVVGSSLAHSGVVFHQEAGTKNNVYTRDIIPFPGYIAGKTFIKCGCENDGVRILGEHHPGMPEQNAEYRLRYSLFVPD